MRIVGLLLAFALGLAGSVLALRGVAERNPSESGGRLEHLVAYGAQYDLIIVGPSYVRYHVLPELFDQRMSQVGYPLRSFVFGIPQMRGPELDYYLERIFELPLPKLKWMMVDVTLDQLRPQDKPNWYKRRLIRWHEPEQFMQMQRAILSRKDTTDPQRRSELSIHGQHLLLNLLNVGEGVTALQSFDALFTPHVHERAAFAPTPPSEKSLRRTAKKYKRRRRWHAELTEALVELRRRPPQAPQPNEAIVGFRNRIRARGVQPLFVLSPLLRDVRFETRIPGDEPLATLDFNDPVFYPALYHYKLRSNATHFHYYGAQVYTLALADRFAAHLAGREGPLPMVERPMIAQPVVEAPADDDDTAADDDTADDEAAAEPTDDDPDPLREADPAMRGKR